MLKKTSIVLSALLVFVSLTISPFFMIDCSETDGSTQTENIFSRCCMSLMPRMDDNYMQKSEVSLNVSHCRCSVYGGSGEYIITDQDNKITFEHSIVNVDKSYIFLDASKNFTVNTSESPPISTNIVNTAVMLI